jgi:hypothetical protein
MITKLRRVLSVALATVLTLNAVLLVAPVALSGAAEAPAYPWSERAATGDYYYDTFENLPKGSVFQLVTSERLTDILSSNGTFYVALGGPGQGTSQKLFPLIQQQAVAEGVSKVYVLDPYVDGYQIDITDASSSSPAQAWLGGSGSASLGSGGVYGASGSWTTRPGDVWTILKHFFPNAASAVNGVLDGFTGVDSALLKVSITDRTTTDIQDGRSLIDSVLVKASELATWNSGVTAQKAAAIGTLINTGTKASSVRSDWEYFKRIYNGYVGTQAVGNASAQFKADGSALRDADFPNGEGFAFHSIDIKEAYNLLNSPGEFPIFFASAACPNTSAVVRATALAAKENKVPVVYIVDPVIDNHLRYGTGTEIDVVKGSQNVGGTYLRNNATGSAYKFSYLYGELAKYFDPGFVTENESKRGNSVAYFPNGEVPASGTTGLSVNPFDASTADGLAVLATGQVRHAKRLQAPTIIRYNKDADNPVVGYWLHEDPDPLTTKSTSPLKTYTEYMLQVNYVEQPSDYLNGGNAANAYKVANPNGGASLSLTQYAVGDEARAALKGVLVTPSKVKPVDDTAPKAFSTASIPTISGTVRVGKTLTANAGAWTPSPTLRYQWYANGATIKNATAKTFKLTTAQLGKKISVKVTGTKSGYTTTAKTSRQTAKVTATFTKAAKPKISGTAKVGKTLKVKVGTWKPKPKYSYQWYANGKKIKKATKSTLKLTRALKGKKITVKVTGKKTNYVTKTVTSAQTKKVKK